MQMIARIAHFNDLDLNGRAYALDAVREVPGFRGAYHLADQERGRGLSVSFWDDADAAKAGEAAVGEARLAGGHDSPGPELVETWKVVRHTSVGH
jgi:heme-degrading monooxygenase HmoA